MLDEKDLQSVRRLIESFQPPITFFEREVLLPHVKGRLDYLKVIFEEFKKIASDKEVAVHIDAALRSVLDPRLFDLGVPEPKVGQQYLSKISEMIDDQFLQPLDALIATAGSPQLLERASSLTEVLTDVYNFMQSIVGVQHILFQYSLKSFLNIKETATGKVLLPPPIELSLMLMPFQVRLSEMVNVAQSTMDSIKSWGDQLREQKKQHVEIIVQSAKVKSAEAQARSAKLTMWFQILVIAFTVILIVFTWRANLFLERFELSKALDGTRNELDLCSAKNGQLVQACNQPRITAPNDAKPKSTR